MINTLRKPKILLATMALVMMLSFGLAVVQNQIIGVSATLHPIMFVSPGELEFGLSFPQEKRTGEFVVVGKNYGSTIQYIVTHERKPLPDGYNGDGEDQNMPGYYRNLCPYLNESIEEDETDTPMHATVDPCQWVEGKLKCGPDNVDYWQVLFDVPTIKGYVDQGFVGIPIEAPGDYGCDVKVAFFEGTYCGDSVKQSPNNSGVGGPKNDGYEDCDGTDGVTEGYECTKNCILKLINGPTCTDNDADGYNKESGDCGTVDCNDNNYDINPGATEVCDNLDNNCDGQTDEGGVCDVCENGQQIACNTGLYGICAAGVQVCSSGQWGSCVQNNQSTSEICNGLDDDCDDQVDEDGVCEVPAECTPGQERSCNTGLPGICAPGTQTCEAGNTNSSPHWGSCVQNTQSTAEICSNGLDDDCDGSADSADSDCEVIGSECGNEVCEQGETCSSCPIDCGDCLISIGGGGGGGGIMGLYIHTVKIAKGATPGSALVTWFTNLPANSRVIYDIVPHINLGTPPNYNYAWSTDTYNNPPDRVTFHTIIIVDLIKNTKYYFRPISAASPEVAGEEVGFIVDEEGEIVPVTPPPPQSEEETSGGQEEGATTPPPAEESAGTGQPTGVGASVTFTPAPEGQVLGEEATSTPTTTEEVAPTSENEQATTTPVFGGFLPGFCCNFWCIIIIIIIVLVISYIYFRQKKDEGNK